MHISTLLSNRALLLKLSQLNEHLSYIDYKNKFYQDVLSGKIPYKSDLIKIDDNN